MAGQRVVVGRSVADGVARVAVAVGRRDVGMAAERLIAASPVSQHCRVSLSRL